MAVKTKEELIEIIRARIGEDNGDEAISLLEDVSDTFDSMSAGTQDGEDWKKKYEDEVENGKKIDEDWRRRYKDRFSGKEPETETEQKKEYEEEETKTYKYEDLFKKEG